MLETYVDTPSIRQTTSASAFVQPSSQTVPHCVPIKTSTLPSYWSLPFTTRTCIFATEAEKSITSNMKIST